MTDQERIEEMLRDVEDELIGVPLTERTRDLQTRTIECRCALESWLETAPSEDQRERMVKRVTTLLAEVKRVAATATGPRSQKIKIV